MNFISLSAVRCFHHRGSRVARRNYGNTTVGASRIVSRRLITNQFFGGPIIMMINHPSRSSPVHNLNVVEMNEQAPTLTVTVCWKKLRLLVDLEVHVTKLKHWTFRC